MQRLKQFIITYGESLLLPIIVIVLYIFGGFVCSIAGLSVIVVMYIMRFFIGYKGPLRIDTPDGNNQPYHPSVVFFENGWNGWKYWMAFTPFPVEGQPYPDRWENPCVVVSQDGIHWQYPDSMRFLDDLTEEQIKNRNYYSDAHLIYNYDEDRIELYYRLNSGRNSDEVSIFRITSSDGFKWSDKKRLNSSSFELYHPEPVSQAVIYQNHKYKMWYVSDTKGNSLRSIQLAESEEGLIWNHISQINLSGKELNPWHIDCRHIDGKYLLLIYSFDTTLTMWESEDGISFFYVKQILKPSHRAGSFYSIRLYRSCLIKANKEWYVYFSAHSGKSHQIGLMTGESLVRLTVKSGSTINIDTAKLFFTQLTEKLFAFEIMLFIKIIRRVNNKKA